MRQQFNYILRKCIVQCLFPFRIFPVKKNRILFTSLEGGSQNEYSCNPKYLCDYISRHREGQYELVWLFSHPENYRFLQKKGIRTARHFTLKGIYYLLTSKVIISNGGYFTWFPFRDEQVCINTWHGGGAYKKLENDTPQANEITRKRMQYAADHIDLFVSSSQAFTENVIRSAFLYNGPVLECGMPRNDILFSARSEKKYIKIRRRLNIPQDARCLLYVPTFRPDSDMEYPDFSRIADTLQEVTGQSWYILTRMHAKASDKALTHTDARCIDVSAYPDTQELLCAADFMISDYSSIIWDFCLTNRPLILYAPDIEDYTGKQGFYVPVTEWGFPICKDNDELILAIRQLGIDDYIAADESHKALLHSFENGHACRDLLKKTEELC